MDRIEAKGLELLQEYIDKYKKTEYPSVSDDLALLLVNALDNLGIRHIYMIGDKTKCPECGFVTGKIGKTMLHFNLHFGADTLCKYCSLEILYKDIMKHNMGDCNCPDKGDSLTWTKDICLAVYNDFQKEYKKILKEL